MTLIMSYFTRSWIISWEMLLGKPFYDLLFQRESLDSFFARLFIIFCHFLKDICICIFYILYIYMRCNSYGRYTSIYCEFIHVTLIDFSSGIYQHWTHVLYISGLDLTKSTFYFCIGCEINTSTDLNLLRSVLCIRKS